MVEIELKVNGREQTLHVQPWETLLEVLRDRLGLTSVRAGCEEGECGTCTVLVNGQPVSSCLVLAAEFSGAEVLTVEGLATEDGALHPIQEAFLVTGAVQCGYCTPGMILAAKALLDRTPQPGEEEIRQALRGQLCRCTGYQQIVEALKKAASAMAGSGT